MASTTSMYHSHLYLFENIKYSLPLASILVRQYIPILSDVNIGSNVLTYETSKGNNN